jgi:type II secretory pathway component GspD/PulD (secretin)
VGVKIEASPKILADGRVHAQMKMSISEVLRENDNSRATRVPVVSYRTVNTAIDFVPGKLELLSELTIQKTVSMESGIPYLRNIPFLGKLLFAHTSKQMVDTKLYIVGGISAPQEQKIREYEALKKHIEEERKNNPRFR